MSSANELRNDDLIRLRDAELLDDVLTDPAATPREMECAMRLKALHLAIAEAGEHPYIWQPKFGRYL